MNLHFKTMNDTDALKIAMFYFADRVLHGRKDHCQINFTFEVFRGVICHGKQYIKALIMY